jgi:predicted transcriptional regulator YheO
MTGQSNITTAIKDSSKKRTSKAFLLESLKLVVDGIARTFGPRCEVVLHDLENLERSIVKIANGHVTERTVGGAITDQGLKFLKGESQEDLLINYPSMTKDGRLLKSSTIIFRDNRKKPIAAICINFDVTDILNFNTTIQEIFSTSEGTKVKEPVETFENDISSTLKEISDRIIRRTGKKLSSMGKSDKIEIVRQLEEQGVFLIKGAVNLIAKKLNVSKFTVYNYLDQVRSENR